MTTFAVIWVLAFYSSTTHMILYEQVTVKRGDTFEYGTLSDCRRMFDDFNLARGYPIKCETRPMPNNPRMVFTRKGT